MTVRKRATLGVERVTAIAGANCLGEAWHRRGIVTRPLADPENLKLQAG